MSRIRLVLPVRDQRATSVSVTSSVLSLFIVASNRTLSKLKTACSQSDTGAAVLTVDAAFAVDVVLAPPKSPPRANSAVAIQSAAQTKADSAKMLFFLFFIKLSR